MTKEQKEEFLQYLENLKLIQADDFYREGLDMAISALKGGWIPLTTRPMTDEEITEYRNCAECGEIFDCPLPDDGQEVLISVNSYTGVDTFVIDEGCYFEQADIFDVDAWQPLPEPYEEETKDWVDRKMANKYGFVIREEDRLKIRASGAEFLEEVGGEIGSSCEKFIRQMTGNEGGQERKAGYISIDDAMSVFDDFMCGEVDEDGTETFLKMLNDKAESEGE